MSCQSCKSKTKVNEIKWGVMIFGTWVLGTSIYGSVIIFSKLIDYIKSVFGI